MRWRLRQDALLLGMARWCSGERALVAHLQLAGKAHGDSQGLWVVDLYIEAEWWLESRGEDLDLLRLRQVAGLGQECLKSFMEVDDGRRALARHQLTQRIGSQGRTEA